MPYNINEWQTGDYVTAEKLNNVESGISELDTNKENLNNKVLEVNAACTDDQYPSARAVWNLISKVPGFDPDGGPTGTLSITNNGVFDVRDYLNAMVNVQPILQSKIITENGTVTPDAGYDGLSSVTVNVSSEDTENVEDLFVSETQGDYMTGWYENRTVTRVLPSGPKLIAANRKSNAGYCCGVFYTLVDYGDISNVASGDYLIKQVLYNVEIPNYGTVTVYMYGGMNGGGLNGTVDLMQHTEISNADKRIRMPGDVIGENYRYGLSTDNDGHYGNAFNAMSTTRKNAFLKSLLKTLPNNVDE